MLLFLLISTLSILLTSLMIFIKTPIYSILCLGTIFLCSIFILFLAKVEFLSYIFILVYVGGIALLFLFVIIMLNLKVSLNKQKEAFNILNGFELLFLASLKIQSSLIFYFTAILNINFISIFDSRSILSQHLLNNDIMGFGLLLYTHYCFYFILSGIILFIGMIGALVLVLNNKKIKNIK